MSTSDSTTLVPPPSHVIQPIVTKAPSTSSIPANLDPTKTSKALTEIFGELGQICDQVNVEVAGIVAPKKPRVMRLVKDAQEIRRETQIELNKIEIDLKWTRACLEALQTEANLLRRELMQSGRILHQLIQRLHGCQLMTPQELAGFGLGGSRSITPAVEPAKPALLATANQVAEFARSFLKERGEKLVAGSNHSTLLAIEDKFIAPAGMRCLTEQEDATASWCAFCQNPGDGTKSLCFVGRQGKPGLLTLADHDCAKQALTVSQQLQEREVFFFSFVELNEQNLEHLRGFLSSLPNSNREELERLRQELSHRKNNLAKRKQSEQLEPWEFGELRSLYLKIFAVRHVLENLKQD